MSSGDAIRMGKPILTPPRGAKNGGVERLNVGGRHCSGFPKRELEISTDPTFETHATEYLSFNKFAMSRYFICGSADLRPPAYGSSMDYIINYWEVLRLLISSD